tara:strand:- start:466 stop:780 length:315 start_codon:yes stop_codon:yes gene_type:complete
MDRKINFDDDDGDDDFDDNHKSLYELEKEFHMNLYRMVKTQYKAYECSFSRTEDILKEMAKVINQMNDEIAALRRQFQLMHEHNQSMSYDIGLIKLKLKIDPYD